MRRKMKLCMVSRVFPPKIGGSGSFLNILSQKLVEDGFEVSVLTQSFKDAPKQEIINGVKIERCFALSGNEFSNINMAAAMLSLSKKIVSKRDHDLFHAHDLSIAGFAGAFSKKFVGKKPFLLKYGGDLVFEYLCLKKFKGFNPKNGLDETFKFRNGIDGLFHGIENWYFRTYDLILPDAFYGKKFLETRGLSGEKIHVLPNGVNTNLFKPCSDKEKIKIKLGLNGKIILCAARLVEWKGIDILITAMEKVLKEEKNARLVIGGDGQMETTLKDLVRKKKLEENIDFVGNISRENMLSYFTAADVFVLPSFFDTTPNVLLEAMACGKACVVSDISGIEEVVENDSAAKFAIGDSDALAETILSLLRDDKKRRKFEKRALLRIREEYSQEKAIERYIKIYNEIIQKRVC